MSLFLSLKMAIKSILSNKLRTFLTMLGIIIGVAAVITAVGFAEGSTKSITSDLESSTQTNMLTVRLMGRITSDVKYEDVAEKLDEISGIDAYSPAVNGNASIKNDSNTSVTTSYIGTDNNYSLVQDKTISEGRFLTSFDIDGALNVAVVGSYIANELFPDNDAVGSYISMSGQKFKIVGILTQVDGGEENSNDDLIIIPYTVAQRLGRAGSINTIYVRVTNSDEVDLIQNLIENELYSLYKDEDYYNVTSQEAMLETLSSVTGTLSIVLGGIAAISLLVGGIGIMNIMIVSVTERTREIGMRKAIGAKKNNILMQFLIEGLILTGLGGILGIALGCVAITIIGNLGLVPAVYSIKWILIAFFVSLLTGIIFGLFPAYKAAKLDPIVALRST